MKIDSTLLYIGHQYEFKGEVLIYICREDLSRGAIKFTFKNKRGTRKYLNQKKVNEFLYPVEAE
jgi:hypothetical protein